MARNPKEPSWKNQLIAFESNGSVKWHGPRKNQKLKIINQSYDYKARKMVYTYGEPVNWQPNKPFKAALKFINMFHGARNSTHAVFQKLGSEATFVMREEHLCECLKKGVLIHGVILGEWRFMQRSGRTSIVPIDFISTIELKNSVAEENE